MTHYEVLGVAPAADTGAIRRAYLRLAREHHPDFHRGAARADAERRMQHLNAAWAVLGDRGRRRDYDRELAAAERRRGTARPGGSAPPRPRARAATSSGQVSDLDDTDDVDPDLLDDEPITDAEVKGTWTLLPVGLLGSSVAAFCVAMVLQVTALLSLAVVLFLLAGLSFLLMPFLAMAGSRRNDLAGGGRP